MFTSLSEKLENTLKSLSGQGRITEVNVAQSMGEVRRALLQADVNYQVARNFTNRIKDQALGARVMRSVAPGQMLVKIVFDELVQLLGGETCQLNLGSSVPSVVLVAGLQGSGKTTFCAKLAQHLQGKGHAPLLAAADVYRPAAVDQLKMLAKGIDVPVRAVLDGDGSVIQDAPRAASEAVQQARRTARDVVIIDTAGRLHIDVDMMEEMRAIRDQTKPDQILFVVDSMTGQDAVNTAREFNNQLDFDGVVLTKLDGDARGGAALSIRSVVRKPIMFASTGEKLDQLTLFHPDRMARRILGMGDVVTLVEKAQGQFDEQQAAVLRRKIRRETFDLEDFLQQLQSIKTMGSMKELAKMIPGVSPTQVDDDESIGQVEAIISSMTMEERRKPHMINASRRLRIARGSGTAVRDVNQLLRQFRQLRKMMKRMMKMAGKRGNPDLSTLLRA